MSSPPPASNRVDRTVSIVILVISVLVVAAASALGLLVFALLDTCDPQRCSMAGAVVSMFGGLGLAALAAVLGVVTTIRMLGRQRSAWPLAAVTLATVVVILICSALAYGSAVGWFTPIMPGA